MQTYNNYIAGEWIAGASVTANRNPSNLADVIGEYAQADAEQATRAIAAAARAFPAWATGSIQDRANSLDKIGSEINLRIGNPIPYKELASLDRNELMEFLRKKTYALGAGLPHGSVRGRRPRYLAKKNDLLP